MPGESSLHLQEENYDEEDTLELRREVSVSNNVEEDKVETPHEEQGKATGIIDVVPATRVLKKKKLKINMHRPVGTRVVFDDEGNTLPPLATLADMKSGNGSIQLDKDKSLTLAVNKRYEEMREELRRQDEEDKLLDRQRRKDRRMKEKMKWKRERNEEDGVESEDLSGSEGEASRDRLTRSQNIF
ncbi:unnamed protein product [Thlaspi arvense]|uniref:Uncharacterized protein n=1 Tax=Thlaspi arvense TaxID=13288 RepID=A0AAU9RFD3_THLAR|nr:unnamed protein product [Thlaspi arvense]